VLSGRLTAGELLAFVFYASVVASGAGRWPKFWGELQRAAGAADRLIELLETASANRRAAGAAVPCARTAGRRGIRPRRFAYPARP